MMLNVPKKVNDALHVSLLDGCDLSLDKLGDVILHDTFQVRDTQTSKTGDLTSSALSLISNHLLPRSGTRSL